MFPTIQYTNPSSNEDDIVFLLNESMELDSENFTDIDFFIYELDFGDNYKPGAISVDGKNIDFSTAEKLYDYLVESGKALVSEVDIECPVCHQPIDKMLNTKFCGHCGQEFKWEKE